MPSFTRTLWRTAFGPRPELLCDGSIWNAGTAELAKRAGGRRESGAFLLGSKTPHRQIREFVFYDDVDPDALKTGIVLIDGRRLGKLWDHCRRTSQSVIADIHLHPGGYQQSASDQANPIIAEVGHIAIILPSFGQRGTQPGEIGIYEYVGSRTWKDRSRDRFSPFHIGWWPRWR